MKVRDAYKANIRDGFTMLIDGTLYDGVNIELTGIGGGTDEGSAYDKGEMYMVQVRRMVKVDKSKPNWKASIPDIENFPVKGDAEVILRKDVYIKPSAIHLVKKKAPMKPKSKSKSRKKK